MHAPPLHLTWQLLVKRTQTLGTDGEAGVLARGGGGARVWWLRYKMRGGETLPDRK